MNRSIKFRAWDYINNKMYSPVDIFNKQGVFYEDETNGELRINEVIDSYGNRNKFEIMQFTGKLDKNGKEIYEGDIVKLYFNEENETQTGVEIVRWDSVLCGFYPFNQNYDGLEYVEVVGNTFNNNDLLPKHVLQPTVSCRFETW